MPLEQEAAALDERVCGSPPRQYLANLEGDRDLSVRRQSDGMISAASPVRNQSTEWHSGSLSPSLAALQTARTLMQ